MTGAGAATVAFVKESSFNTLPATPTYYQPGRNIQIQDIELSNALQNMRDPGSVEPSEAIAGRAEGAFQADWVMSLDTHDDVRDIIFNNAGGSFTNGVAATSHWYTGVDYLNGTAERVLGGVTPTGYEIRYDVNTNTIRESLTAVYADEDLNTTITPSSIVGPADGNDVPFHGLTLDINATTVKKLQSATLRWDNIARLQYDAARNAVDAVIAAPTPALTTEAIFDDDNHLQLAYGSTTATTTQASITAKSGTLTFDVGGTTVATYSLPECKPDTYNWSDLVNGENDLIEPITWNVTGGVTIT